MLNGHYYNSLPTSKNATMLNIILIITVIVVSALIAAIYFGQAPEKWSTGEVLKTPQEAFENLPDYDFSPNYVNCLGYQLHYLDEGPKDGPIVLLLHGQPSWSYLYRHMIPLLSDAGFRVIAPDNVGFGKSDKPIKQSDHNYQMHIDVMTEFVDQLDIQGATLFAQDWGGLIGLRVVANRGERFSRIMLSNTALPAAKGILAWLGYPLFRVGVWREGDVQNLGSGTGEFKFTEWVAYAQTTNNFDFKKLFQRATSRKMQEHELAGYAAPYPNNDYIAAIRKFPTMVASQLRQNQKVMNEFYAKWDKPLLTAYGTDDLLMKGRDKVWQHKVPGAKGQPHTLIEGGAHFIQEDKPEELVEHLIKFIQAN